MTQTIVLQQARRFLWGVLMFWAIACGYVGADSVMVAEMEISHLNHPGVTLEWLEFRVDAAERDAFLVKDEQIWTAALHQQPGFLHKSVILSPDDPESVGFLIYWATRELWKAFPEDLTRELDRQMQPTSAILTQSREYPVWSYTGTELTGY